MFLYNMLQMIWKGKEKKFKKIVDLQNKGL